MDLRNSRDHRQGSTMIVGCRIKIQADHTPEFPFNSQPLVTAAICYLCPIIEMLKISNPRAAFWLPKKISGFFANLWKDIWI